ncbi:MAG: hypothetical protein HOH33_09815 [Verrucomicrobia bacterium]|nr:hypothetical protein [Verrucomicrobiota bacterium]
MTNHIERIIVLGIILFCGCLNGRTETSPFQGSLIEARDLVYVDHQEPTRQSIHQLVVAIQRPPTIDQASALTKLREDECVIWYWVEVARDEALAASHPEWMASIQGHPEWRRFYPDFPEEKEDQIVKVYPWVPIFYQGAFEAQSAKVKKLLQAWPEGEGVFLNDLQGAPSACGCGHPLCRWTTDYGPKLTAEQLGHDAPAQFVQQMEEAFPNMECIPVWATECEAHDKDGWCAGVGCYKGACWREWSRQLEPLALHSKRLGALAIYKELGRDLDHYSQEAEWVSMAIRSFQSEMDRYQRPSVMANRLIAVLLGWDVSPEEIKAQIEQSKLAGASGYVIAKTPIQSGWVPKMVPLKSLP